METSPLTFSFRISLMERGHAVRRGVVFTEALVNHGKEAKAEDALRNRQISIRCLWVYPAKQLLYNDSVTQLLESREAD